MYTYNSPQPFLPGDHEPDFRDLPVLRYSTIFISPFYYSGTKSTIINKLTEKKHWETKIFSYKETTAYYSEYVYFHPYIRDILFSQENEPEKRPMTYLKYCRKESQSLRVFYSPKTQKDHGLENNVVYPVTSINLNLFEFGVGLLSIQISEESSSSKQPVKTYREVLCLNELARRTAPSFDLSDQLNSGYIPEAICLENDVHIREDFKDYKSQDIQKEPYISKLICHLLSPLRPGRVLSRTKPKNGDYFENALDERMVVYSYVCLKENRYSRLAFQNDNFLSFAFVDTKPGDSYANTALVNNFAKEIIYDRWRDYNTLFGFSRYSGVVLTQAEDQENEFPYKTLFNHFESIYYEIALLTFFNRAVLLKFSKQAADCAEDAKQGEPAGINQLWKEYLVYTNKYWFTEITNQDQGIDMFDQWAKVVRNKQLFEEVEKELKNLNEYTERTQAFSLQRLARNVSILALSLGFVSLWLSYLNVYTRRLELPLFIYRQSALVLDLLTVVMLTTAIYYFYKGTLLRRFESFLRSRTKLRICNKHIIHVIPFIIAIAIIVISYLFRESLINAIPIY